MLAKPSKLARETATYNRRLTKAATRRRTKWAELRAWMDVCRLVKTRDKGRCRACGADVTTYGGTAHPSTWGNVHHIVYRSAGGRDETRNLALLCGQCHSDEHQHRLDITGDGDGEIIVTRRDAC